MLHIVLGAAGLCFLCCALGLVGQYLLENSDFTLVYLPGDPASWARDHKAHSRAAS